MEAKERAPRVQLALVVLAIAGALSILAILAVAESAPAQSEGGAPQELKVEKAGSVEASAASGKLSAAQKLAISQGYLVPDPDAYEQAKDRAEERAEELSPKASSASVDSPSTPSGSSAPTQQFPTNIRSWEGVNDTAVGPSDSTGAIGPTRYMELVNRKYAIYDRVNNAPLNSGTLNQLAGVPSSDNVFDPQVMWDGRTNRFFYVADDIVSSTTNRLAFGFSKTSTPSSSADFCKYVINFGSRFPDYPKLGDTANRLLIGANAFGTSGFLGSDLYSITKPPSGSTCPAPSTFAVGKKFNISGAFTPVPANQTDDSTKGYVVARTLSLPSTRLLVYDVNESGSTFTLSAARNLTVPSYSVPADAPQPATTRKLDTLDARPTQAVSAFDPRFSRTAIWTQHTIFGGAGAHVRWYEINPSTATPSLFQSGLVTGSQGLHVFNAAISPDRKVLGLSKAFGDSMVIGYNSSATTQRADIRVRSKIGAGPIQGPALVKSSAFSMNDFTCASGTCRWGDYAAATPDPGAPVTSGGHGQVWLTNKFVKSTGSSSSSGWGSWNFATKP